MNENKTLEVFVAPTESQWIQELANREEITSWSAMIIDGFMRATVALCPVARAKAIKKKITLPAINRHTKGSISVDASLILHETRRLYEIVNKYNQFMDYRVHLFASSSDCYVIEHSSSGIRHVLDRHSLTYDDFIKSTSQDFEARQQEGVTV